MPQHSRFNPKPGILDFWNEFRKPNPYRWPILAASMIPFGLIFAWVSSETVYAPPERPQVTYVSTFPEGRTDEEIAASNAANQALNDQIAEREAEIEEQMREVYRSVGAATGLDVDAMEERAEAERAREAAAEEARRNELYGAAAGQGGGNASEESSAE
ncbi:MAG: hypothetical protein AAGK02_12200 [Pseudomonadota bacterium]